MAEAAFGVQLRQSRQAAALSLRQLAVRVGYDHSYLSQVERGQRPGSADLARLCDRELGTGDKLTASYAEMHRKPEPPADPLEAAWLALTSAYDVRPAEELGAARDIPPAQLLPELVAEVQLLQGQRSTGTAVRSAQLCVLIAETLTGLGQLGTARRWWRAARVAADSSGEAWVRSVVRAREAVSGLAERRDPTELLELADEALELTKPPLADGAAQRPVATRPGCVVQAQAARARVLAELGRAAEAHQTLQQLLGVADELPLASTTGAQLSDLTAYEARWAEGQVCASLGYGAAGCVLLARALELCPAGWLAERAGVELGLAECLVVDGEIAAGLSLAMRVLVELPDEWHTYYLYDAAERVLSVVRGKAAGAWELQALLGRRAYLGNRSVGSGSRNEGRQG
ncbi:transcriptional regulator with XRE-family HTH domain [Kribbella antiqua]|uniref:Transcriptional regulator with XRE-family HTH domain n=1 Tax=Kribbella antiqua TaxID=2512217 RepID=A0A4R2IKT1_9ACTN|nr:helix-turn-helix transcriptional regulator [Kribbella antiqua]TCO45584.1 transcriptional regulator with XRE-family HTH domain [Kribbella antiqua]